MTDESSAEHGQAAQEIVQLDPEDRPLELTSDQSLRSTALILAIRYVSETIIKDGQMYQVMTAQGKNMTAVSTSTVLEAAIDFEHYLRTGKIKISPVSDTSPAAPDAEPA